MRVQSGSQENKILLIFDKHEAILGREEQKTYFRVRSRTKTMQKMQVSLTCARDVPEVAALHPHAGANAFSSQHASVCIETKNNATSTKLSAGCKIQVSRHSDDSLTVSSLLKTQYVNKGAL